MDFNVTEYEKFISRVLDSTLQLTFEKSLLIKFWCSIKEECLNYLKRLLHTILFSTTCLCTYRFPSYSSTKMIYSNKLNVEADENSAIFY